MKKREKGEKNTCMLFVTLYDGVKNSPPISLDYRVGRVGPLHGYCYFDFDFDFDYYIHLQLSFAGTIMIVRRGIHRICDDGDAESSNVRIAAALDEMNKSRRGGVWSSSRSCSRSTSSGGGGSGMSFRGPVRR